MHFLHLSRSCSTLKNELYDKTHLFIGEVSIIMREKSVCRFCENQFSKSIHLGSNQLGMSGGRKPFAISGSSPRYAPDRPFRLEHILLNLKVDPKLKTLRGSVTQKVRVVAPDQKILKLDQIGLQIDEVKINERPVDFRVEDQGLVIYLGQSPQSQSPQPQELLDVVVTYCVTQPKRGIYFTGPDEDYPSKPFQVWTQGQDEDSRHWFPTLDYPSQKSTSEIIVHVPKGFTAVSNGALLSRDEKNDGTTFHYRLGTPHVTYLITLVVAEFSEWADQGPRGLPVQYFVAKGREEDGKRAFQNTPQMISAFETKTGVEYPYEKYSQAAVQDFIFGGMENTSATTQTELTLHDERAHLDFSSDPLVSHELAHQWFGDLVTCRDWSHGWLNEGFATFMERVWVESKPGPEGGAEEAKYYSYQDWKEYLADDQGKYRRPIVCNTYIEPIDLFDTHLYQKGGLVLNLLRHVLGEDQFWKSVNFYVNRHRGQNVETLDLIRAIEETTGRNMRQFFDEWVFNAGYPEFEVSYQWHEDKKMTEWVIEQKQTGGALSATKDGATTLLFHLPVCLEMTLSNGEKLTHTIQVGELRERVFLPAPSRPVMARLDSGFNIPKTLKFPRPKDMLLHQLAYDTDCMGRIEAVQELVKVADSEVVTALGKSVAADVFWGVQAEAAKALAEIRTEIAKNALLSALGTRHPKARRAIALALGTFRDEKVAESLKKFAEHDPSYYVEANATHAWASARLKPSMLPNHLVVEEVEKFLISQLSKPSYRDAIRSAALSSLADLPGVGTGERPIALQTLIDWTKRGRSDDVRGAAVRSLGRVLKTARPSEQTRILDLLSELADEDNFRVRMQLVAALEESGYAEGIFILKKIQRFDLDGRVKRGAQVASDVLMMAGTAPESVQQMKTSLEKLEEDYRKFRSFVEERIGATPTMQS
jgi:aminopeptidase N